MHLQGHQPHILAMDNSPEVCALYAEVLGEEGYSVSTCSFATHDLDDVVSVRPDLIILDHRWFSDESGWAQLQMLRADPRTEGIPTILCTAARGILGSLSTRLAELDVQIVLKPFAIEELLQVVESSVGCDPTLNLNLYPFTGLALQ